MTAFSEFIRNATIEEKRVVYDKVIKEACMAQRRAAGIPTGEQILAVYEKQPIDARMPLVEILDNAIAMTMRACWGLNDDGHNGQGQREAACGRSAAP